MSRLSVPGSSSLVERAMEVLGSAPAARWLAASALEASDPSAVLEAMIFRLESGEPLQYVMGTWQFRFLELSVDARALIPRPETEQVVEVALGLLAEQVAKSDVILAADLGTGSGAIALSLATETCLGESDPELMVWATDVSAGAIALAAENILRTAETYPRVTSRVELARGAWFDALSPELAGRLSLLVSNPPYLSATEFQGLDRSIRDHEPCSALVAGERGTEALEEIIARAPAWLRPGGALVCEIAPHQAPEVARMAIGAGLGEVRVETDLAGRPRVLVGRR